MKQLEKEFVDKLEIIFSEHFIVKRECTSKCEKGRIDMILIYKNDKNIVFGIECKIPNKKRGEEIGRFVNQAILYTKMEFDIIYKENPVFKKIPILIAPALSYNYFILKEKTIINKDEILEVTNIWNVKDKNNEYHKDRHHKYDKHHTFNGFLGSFNIGEVRNQGSGNYIFSLSNFILFSCNINAGKNDGSYVHYNNYNKLKL
jgi:hypothetical protein